MLIHLERPRQVPWAQSGHKIRVCKAQGTQGPLAPPTVFGVGGHPADGAPSATGTGSELGRDLGVGPVGCSAALGSMCCPGTGSNCAHDLCLRRPRPRSLHGHSTHSRGAVWVLSQSFPPGCNVSRLYHSGRQVPLALGKATVNAIVNKPLYVKSTAGPHPQCPRASVTTSHINRLEKIPSHPRGGTQVLSGQVQPTAQHTDLC